MNRSTDDDPEGRLIGDDFTSLPYPQWLENHTLSHIMQHEPNSPLDVIHRIEQLIASILKSLDNEESPVLSSGTVTRKFNMAQCRSFTSIVIVLSFVHSLLLSNRTTTTREVYYFFVTHFRSQRECDAAILDAGNLLGVPRVSMGLSASPKGWFCGCIALVRQESVTDARFLSSVQGLPITREWIDRSQSWKVDFSIQSNAKCILVIEKEGVYTRLSEDRFFDRYPCILVTGKGYPDLATRALVHGLFQELNVPVYGVCDCNPFGMGVLQTYQCGSRRMGVDGGDRYSVPIQWLGLRPTQVHYLQSKLPRDVYQSLGDVDKRRLEKMIQEGDPFHNSGEAGRLDELHLMKSKGYKVELEALHWLGMDYMSNWLEDILMRIEGFLWIWIPFAKSVSDGDELCSIFR